MRINDLSDGPSSWYAWMRATTSTAHDATANSPAAFLDAIDDMGERFFHLIHKDQAEVAW